jgi:hypothetical protein
VKNSLPARPDRNKTDFCSILIYEGHKPFGALYVFGVARAQRARKRILLHIHPVNESRANRYENNKQGGPVAQRQAETHECQQHASVRRMTHDTERTSLDQLMVLSIVTSTVKKRPRVMMAHQRRINPATNNTTPALANIRPCGSAPARKFCATKMPAVTLTAITSQIIPSVLRSCFVPVLLRDRRVKLRRISETR